VATTITRRVAVTNYIYAATGEAVGFSSGQYVYNISGKPVGQLRDTHVYKLSGEYIGELYADMVVEKNIGKQGSIESSNPGSSESPGSPRSRGARNYGYRDAFNKLLT
jgi:hypothetical protein